VLGTGIKIEFKVDMKIFSGTNSKELTKRICEILNKEQSDSGNWSPQFASKVGNLKIEKFSDGEILPRFDESIRDQDIYFINSTCSSDDIMETLLVVDAAKRAGCKSFTLVTPFQGYSRQDKTDHLRSSIGSKVLADILETVGISRIITIDLHASAIQGFYNVPVIHLNGNKIFINHIKKNKIENLTILAPDQGAVKRASDFCKAFPEATFAMINKKRIKPNEIHSMELVGDVSGRNVIMVDDMADTLGTMKKAADLVIEKGASSVIAVATHGVLSGKAIENLDTSKLIKLMTSDTIPTVLDKQNSKLDVISCAELIAKSIWSLSQKKSIHEINVV
jgi:ribose-phosphate pyrophosphokinase